MAYFGKFQVLLCTVAANKYEDSKLSYILD